MIFELLTLSLKGIEIEGISPLSTRSKYRESETPRNEYFDKTLNGNFGIALSNCAFHSNNFVHDLFQNEHFHIETNHINTLKAANMLFSNSRSLDSTEQEALTKALEAEMLRKPTRKNRF